MKMYLALLIGFLSLLPSFVYAGGIILMVSDEKAEFCRPSFDPRIQNLFILTSEEMIGAISGHFPEATSNNDISAIQAGIVNAGIRFCSEREKEKVQSALVDSFADNMKAKETATNYYRSKVMRRLINERLNSPTTSAQHKSNLKKFVAYAEKAWSRSR